MANNKYPYIPKEYYAAVMFACKMIRENGQFNRAIRTASSYYGIDEEIIEKHVRERQRAGQKYSKHKRKYFYFAIEYCFGTERYNTDWFEKERANYCVKKATSESNAHIQISDEIERKFGFDYLTTYGRTEAFSTKEEAVSKAKQWISEPYYDKAGTQ